MCHTDFNEYANGPIFVSGTPHARTGRSVPLVLGHEFSGQIVQTGSDVTELKIGDRVAINAVDSCGACPYCIRGYSRAGRAGFISRIHQRLTWMAVDAGCCCCFAEFAAVPAACCHVLPARLPYRDAVFGRTSFRRGRGGTESPTGNGHIRRDRWWRNSWAWHAASSSGWSASRIRDRAR